MEIQAQERIQHSEQLTRKLLTYPKTIRGQMFGKPSLTVNGNAFVVFEDSAMVFKLPPPSRAAASRLEGAAFWDPSGKGRPMKEWVAIPLQHMSSWEHYANISREYIEKLTSRGVVEKVPAKAASKAAGKATGKAASKTASKTASKATSEATSE